MLALVGREAVLQPRKQWLGVVRIGEHVDHDLVEQGVQGFGVVGGVGQAWSGALDVAHDRHAERVEGPDGETLRCAGADAGGQAVLHLVPGVPSERQHQEFGALVMPCFDEPCRLGDDDRGLAAAGGGDDKVVPFVCDNSGALLGRQGFCFDGVEEGPEAVEFAIDVERVRLFAGVAGVGEKFPYLFERPVLRMAKDGWRGNAREVFERGAGGSGNAVDRGTGDVCARVGQAAQGGMDCGEGGVLPVEDMLPPAFSRASDG